LATIAAAPVQVPDEDDSVCPSVVVPVTVGSTVLTGGWAGPTTVVATDVPVALPASLVAVTTILSVWSRSASSSW
jgi:hypothetical protein